MTSFLLENGYVDTSCQKAGVHDFTGCVEHPSVIWEQIPRVKRERSDLHVMWLDVANAYGSVAQQLLDYATEFFLMPGSFRILVSNYFKDLRMAISLQEFSIGWQQLEMDIAMGCSISPILFVSAFDMILITERQVVGGVRQAFCQHVYIKAAEENG